jgi:hypothetical protein
MATTPTAHRLIGLPTAPDAAWPSTRSKGEACSGTALALLSASAGGNMTAAPTMTTKEPSAAPMKDLDRSMRMAGDGGICQPV